MKKTFTVYLWAAYHPQCKEYSYTVTSQDGMQEHGWIPLETIEIERDVPEADELQKRTVDALRRKLAFARGEMQARINAMEQQINDMLALEHKPEGVS